MPIVLRVTALPPLADIQRVPQIVIVDQTGNPVFLGTSAGISMLVGEFLKGPANSPTEITSDGQGQALYGGISGLLSQGSTGAQDGNGVPTTPGGAVGTFNGNGMLQLKYKTFKRLGITRVNVEAVTTDGGTTMSPLTLTVTVAAADQTGGVTNKDILIPAGTRFADAALGSNTFLLATAQDVTIPSGSTVTSNHVTASVTAFFVFAPATIVSTVIGAVDTVIDAALQNVDAGTTITAVTNAAVMWPPGTGTSLALRITSQYAAALTATMPGASDTTTNTVVVWAARRSTTVRQGVLANAIAASANGRGRIACMAADPAAGTSSAAALAATTAATALASTESLQQDRAVIAYPHTQIVVEELGSISVLINPDGWMASILSNFVNERNPGANPAGLMDSISALDLCYVGNPLQVGDYANLIGGGVCPILKDRTLGWKFLDGVTAVNQSDLTQITRVPIKRRRMADEIEDNSAQIAAPFNNEPVTQDAIDAFTGEMESYLDGLLSPTNPALQRINGYVVDPVSGNTPDLLAVGIFTLVIKVKTLSDFRDIILQSSIGETVVLPAAA
jgi:hypothetical protein